MLEPQAWDVFHTNQDRRSKSSMTSHDHVVLVDQDWIGETVLLDTVSNLFDLLFGMGTRIARIGSQA